MVSEHYRASQSGQGLNLKRILILVLVEETCFVIDVHTDQEITTVWVSDSVNFSCSTEDHQVFKDSWTCSMGSGFSSAGPAKEAPILQIPLVSGCHFSCDEMGIVPTAGTGGRRAVRTVGTEASWSRRCLELVAHGEHLLPGIPNDITLELIAPKVSWRDFPVLASMNKAWLHAVRSGLLFDAIVHGITTETLVLLSYEKVRVTSETSNVLVLYSPKENLCLEVPPIPCCRDGLPLFCQFASLDGKIYVVGGTTYEDPFASSEKVYVFDLAGGKVWKECASMKEPRANFGCGVLRGKIYTFGGDGPAQIGCASEVYDPTTDIWSPIMPMLSSRAHHRVLIVGEELVDYDGDIFGVYHPVRNEWRELSCGASPREIMFAAQGKLYGMSGHHMFRKFAGGWNTGWHWYSRLSFSFAPFWPPDEYDEVEGWSAAILVVDDELLVLTKYKAMVIILQSRGFGVEWGEITWQVKGELPFPVISSGNLAQQSYCMHPIQL